MTRRVLILTLALALCATPLCGQAKPHQLIFVAGAARNSGVDETSLLLGAGYRLALNPKFHAGGAVEWTNGDTADIWTFLGEGTWRITKRVSLLGGIGFEMVNATDSSAANEEESNFLFRAGGGFELLRGKKWSLTPRVTIDFSQSGDSTVGVAAEIGFGS
jgi:hypothetical protein